MDHQETDLRESYISVLHDYLSAQSERSLYNASLLSKLFVEQGIGPEEIVALHSEAIDEASRELPALERARVFSASFQFLLEIMITYGVRYKEYLDLKLTEATRSIQTQIEIDRIKAQESIKAQEQILRGKEEFLSFVAHELRNPLTVIMGSIDYMLKSARSGNPERQTQLLERTSESTQQLLKLINDLLSISQMDFAGQSVNAQLVEVETIIRDAFKTVRNLADDKHIELALLPERMPYKLFGDHNWLLVMFGNLLSNAIKFTPEYGKVWVTVEPSGANLKIDVRDTGIGIAPEVLPHIFEKYYRVKGGGTPLIQGSGLGLPLVKRIVERHNGKVSVDSKLGEGTVFTVLLPVAD